MNTNRDAVSVRLLARAGVAIGAIGITFLLIQGATGYVVYTLAGGLAFVLTAFSVVVVTGYLGQISLAPAAFMGIGAFTTAIAVVRFELPFGLAAILGTLVGALAGAVIALPAMRVQGLVLAVVTMAFAASMDYTLFSNEWFTGYPVGMVVPRPYIPGIDLSDDRTFFWALAVVVVLVAVGVRRLRSTWNGRCWAAIRDDEVAASTLGISVGNAKVTAFALGAALAAFGGSAHVALVGFVNGGPATSYSAASSLTLAVMVTLVGVRSVTAAVIAGLMYAGMPLVVDELFGGSTQGLQWAGAVMAVLLVLTLMVHSQGLVHWVADVRRQRSGRGTRPATVEYDTPSLPEVVKSRGTSDRSVLAVEGLSKRFGGLVAVNDVCLQVDRSEVVALIGPNGAGKTTLFNAVSGLEPPDAGEIQVHGRGVTSLGPHDRAAVGVGRTFQVPRVWGHLTAWEHVWLALEVSRLRAKDGSRSTRLLSAARRGVRGRAHRANAEASRDRDGNGRLQFVGDNAAELADELLTAVGLHQFRDVRAQEMSLGTIRRLELARALATRPRVLLLDEPSSGLDAYAVERLAHLIRQLCEEFALGVLVVEHNTAFVRAVADRAVAMSFGKVIADGSVDDVYRDKHVLDAYLGRHVREGAR